MKFFGLLATSLASAQASSITMYANGDCSGENYVVQDPRFCDTPANLPAAFDAKAIKVEGVDSNCEVWLFTDNSQLCTAAIPLTWWYWPEYKLGDCLP